MKRDDPRALLLPGQCEDRRLPVPEREYRFHPTRRWRFDYSWPALGIAAEVEGAVWVRGRHTRGQGYIDDMEKYNAAQLRDWRVFRFTWEQVENGEAVALLSMAIAQEQARRVGARP